MAKTPDFSVAGKHVLITGGTGGIGSAFAEAFLNHGAHVIVADLAASKEGTDPRVRYEQLDVRDDAAVHALATRVEKLDVVIHCAGRASPVEEYKPEVFKDILDIHLVGNLRLANAFRPHLKASSGCFINIASDVLLFRLWRAPAYSAAKTVGVWKEIASRAKQERAERKKVLALAQAHKVDVILVTELTRGGRSARFAARSLTCFKFRFVSSPQLPS